MMSGNTTGLIRSALLLSALMWSAPAWAQAPAKVPGRPLTLTAGDGWPIHTTYFEATPAKKEAPVVILIPGAEGSEIKDSRNRRVWDQTALALQKKGYAVISVDLRKHGDSVPTTADGSAAPVKTAAGDYAAMAALDLEAVKDFLLKEHESGKLNIRKLGIVAIGSSAMVAATFAVADWDKKPHRDAPTPELSTPRGQDVRTLIMISPKSSVKGLNTTIVLRVLKALPIAISVHATSNDKQESRDAEKIYKAIELKIDGAPEARKLTLAPVNASAERFLEGKEGEVTNELLIQYLDQTLNALPDVWRTRKSRLQ